MPSIRGSSRDMQGRSGSRSRESNENVDIEVLRKEYRNMQANRNAFAHESDLVLRKQQATLDKLRAENETLKADVSRLQTRNMTRPINSFEQSQLDRLYQELDKFTVLVETEKSKASAMEKEITELRDEIWKRRKQMGGVNAAATNQRNVQKQVSLLESRLDQALVKFNKTVSRNKRLREEIDSLRGERVTFEKVYRKIEKDLRETKKQMALVIEQSNQAYEQRDKAQLEIVAIEQADRKDEDAYHQQMNELSDELEEINQQLLNSTRRNQQPFVVDPIEEERKAAERREAARANEIARAEEEYAQQRKERMQNFEEAFRKISAATGINDVDELIRVFIENEEQNFSLFRYMNEQTAEIERLEDEINALQEEGERVRAKQGDGNDREEVLKIEKQIKTAIEQTAMYDAKCEEQQKLLDEVKDEIKVGIVYKYIICLVCRVKTQQIHIEQLLMIRLNIYPSGQEGELSITTDNVLHYLGLVEERAIDIVSNYNRLQAMTDNANKKMSLSDQNGSRRLSINPPRLLDYSSDENSDDGNDSSCLRPVHRNDLDYSKLASRASMAKQSSRKTVTGRRGSLIFGGRMSMVNNVAFAPGP
ncbi:hypothetical protein ACHAXN_012997 [Cyclotella atomus]